MLRWLTIFSGLVFATPAFAQGPTHGVPGAELRLAGALYSTKREDQVVIVQLREPPALAAARGGIGGMAASRGVGPPRMLQARSGNQTSHAQRLEASHDRLLAEIGAGQGKLYSYRHSFNGFAARLTGEQVAQLARHPDVTGIWPDQSRPLNSGESMRFLGFGSGAASLDTGLGLRGEGIIIGIIDSGVAPGHPSLSDRDQRPLPRLCRSEWARVSLLGRWLCRSHRQSSRQLVYEPPAQWNGICQAGEAFTVNDCNNKLIGARYYNEGFLATNELDPGEFLSPRDADGHGTHIASIAAGNDVEASLFGTRIGRIRGVAPRAYVAVYKACWLRPGETRATCNTSDLARAIDDAVADGVDIINYSVGNPESGFNGPDDLALLFAADAGVFTAVAAGNDGPAPGTIGAPGDSPWITTVAANTRDGRRFEEGMRVIAPASVAGDLVMREATFTALLSDTGPISGELRQVDDGIGQLPDGTPGSRDDACQPLVNRSEISGHVALIRRGGCTFETKLSRAQAAGATAVIVYNTAGPPITMLSDGDRIDIPAIMIGASDGQRLVAALAEGQRVEVELSKGRLIEEIVSGNVMGEFSARGPNLAAPDLIKPDLTAPGVDMLGGHTRDPATGQPGERFQVLSGTSQSAPVVAGLAALLREQHPDWTPAMIKSAMMTSAYQTVVLEDGETPAGPFAMGAGHVRPAGAVTPGAVYDADLLDYVAFACGLDPSPFPPTDCALLSAGGLSLRAQDLNLPSIGVGALVGSDQVRRRLTATQSGSFVAEIDAPPGTQVSVTPSTLNLGTGETANYTVNIDAAGIPLNEWRFGSLTWRSADHAVRSPLAAQARALAAPGELQLAGVAGETTFQLRAGYTGSYTPQAHGLRQPLVVEGFVQQDPQQRFTFRDGSGVTQHLIDIPPDQAYARFALADELTSGNDDLDLYLFYCPGDVCTQVGQSIGLSSDETVSLLFPAPGRYAALVHGFATDPASGPGADYLLLAWSFGVNDDVGNMLPLGPGFVSAGEEVTIELRWQDLEADSLYLGGISHNTPEGLQGLTVIRIDTRAP
ncbi:MAG: S8 family serine peptidase [Gammaproteobacteria bacterium]|nr:S8 family serine peptidase [Gammaproteobacteria bacterium]